LEALSLKTAKLLIGYTSAHCVISNDADLRYASPNFKSLRFADVVKRFRVRAAVAPGITVLVVKP
jgi:hypothetical protein